MKNLLKSIFILFGTVTLVSFSTNSYFSSQASVVGNEFSAGVWTPILSPIPTTSNDDTIRICHAAGQKGNYQEILSNVEGVINGHAGTNHQDGRDVIPPFGYGEPTEHFAGQNWDTVGQAIYNNNCEIVVALPAPSPLVLPSVSPE